LTGNTNTTAFTVSANAESAALGVTTSATVNNAVAPVSATRTTLQGNYNNILTQIDQLAGDASYNGINLLAGDNLKVLFNETGTSSLNIAGVNFNSKGLGLSAASGTGFLDNNNVTATETAINAAISAVRAQTETFGTNSSTISTRQTFEQNMINTLQTGASNLVLADQNQESANLLTLQTQQQLEISALSIANQANQSVLKLFP
jgi:flagellin-like hook-associated protein FlgL